MHEQGIRGQLRGSEAELAEIANNAELSLQFMATIALAKRQDVLSTLILRPISLQSLSKNSSIVFSIYSFSLSFILSTLSRKGTKKEYSLSIFSFSSSFLTKMPKNLARAFKLKRRGSFGNASKPLCRFDDCDRSGGCLQNPKH